MGFQGGRSASGLSAGVGPQQPRIKWTANIGGWASPPILTNDGIVYFGDDSGRFNAYYTASGEMKWSIQITERDWPAGLSPDMQEALAADGVFYGAHFINSPVVAEDGTIYFGTTFFPRAYEEEDKNSEEWYEQHRDVLGVYAIDPRGEQKWFYRTGVDTASSIAIGLNRDVYFRTQDALHALTPTGGLRWTFPLDGGATWSNPAVAADGTIYVVDRALRAIRPDGRLKWSLPDDGSWIAVFTGHPSIGPDGTVFLSTHDLIYAIGPDGVKRWSRNIGWTESSPSIGPDGTVYVGTAALLGTDPKFYALDPRNGEVKWTFDLDASIDVSSVVGSDGVIYFGADDGYYRALSPAGKLLWKFDLGRVNIPSIGVVGAEADGAGALGPGGTLYFGHSGGPLVTRPDGTYKFYAIGE